MSPDDPKHKHHMRIAIATTQITQSLARCSWQRALPRVIVIFNAVV